LLVVLPAGHPLQPELVGYQRMSVLLCLNGEAMSLRQLWITLSYRRKIPLRQSLILKTPEDFKSRFNIDVRICHEVTSVDPVNKTVTVKNLTSGEVYSEEWDRLLLSTGAAPVVPPLPGLQEEGVFTLRNLTDMDAILGGLSNIT
jgi:NADPH-dependent 2,4-dienoyl-CoA reductase/sulfur reductase-like enzyme